MAELAASRIEVGDCSRSRDSEAFKEQLVQLSLTKRGEISRYEGEPTETHKSQSKKSRKKRSVVDIIVEEV